MLIPNAENAIVDIRKLRDYCLNSEHDEGQHKARLFSSILGMTNQTIKLLDVVALTVDFPEYNLWRGQVGTVVEILANGAAFEVEFCDCAKRTLRDRNGRTYESIGLRPEQIMVLRFEPITPDSTPETATV